MSAVGQKYELTPEDFTSIRDYIHDKAGIFFNEKKMYLLQSRLSKRMEQLGVASFRDYFYRVKYDTSHAEFNQLMNLVTTNETYFYRNEPQLESFASEALPEILSRKRATGGPKTLKIWSAGCSTGEEPYTLGMIVREAIGAEPGWQIEIIANDISENVLAQARLGEYHGATLRYVPKSIIGRYFEQCGEKYRVTPEIRGLVKFVQLNLNETHKLSMYRDLDVIFCRNVMIYFSEEVKKRIVKGYYQALAPGGLMYIGHSETLHGISKSFKLRYFKGALVYEKEAAGGLIGAEAKRERSGADTTKQSASPAAGAPSGAQRAMELLAKIKANREAQQKLAQNVNG